jgi:hypothetical protein
MSDDDPNEAYVVVPLRPGAHGPPRGWWTVKRNGIPVKHFPGKEKAERYATDPKYRASLVIGKPWEQAKRPRDIADQIRDLRNYRKVKGNDSLIRETFTLPLEQARTKARQILDAYPAGGYMTIVENWRQLPDGQIEFTMRGLPTAD